MCFSFYEKYFAYIGQTEAPMIYHRWCAISMIGALLGRNFHFPFGHSSIFPNQYMLLTGSPGTRKGTAMKPAKNLLKTIGYKKTAPEQTSSQRFLYEMQKLNAVEVEEVEGMELEILDSGNPSEIYVVSDEFGDFIKGDINFIRTLTNLWDNLPEYRHPKLHGKDVYVFEPTVNIIGATTPSDMAQTMPIEAIGQGALSRYILIHADPTGIQIDFPPPPDPSHVQSITDHVQEIREKIKGEAIFPLETRELCGQMYRNAIKLEDPRFTYYNTRRYTHLLKLGMIFAAMDLTMTIEPKHILQANTLLAVTEHRMPKALGEFGKARNADVANLVMEKLRATKSPLTVRQLFKFVSQDVNKMEDLVDLIKGLQQAEKIQALRGPNGIGYLPLHAAAQVWNKDLLIQEEFLLAEERT